ncbi:MAG: hypothetical protein BGO57_12380 [Sphingomonadales bacterium 63-6]|nr:MAG: hypothetical protein BGO57_12380 [Sphingomonadales bacterium 63-6]
MDLGSKIDEVARTMRAHREVLATEEAAKNALVMPFLQALGYNVFNPGEVVPEFTCDVGTKKGEKVDYAIKDGDAIRMLVECKPANGELNLKHASQLFRYFSAIQEVRVAVLTNGVIYKFYSDIDAANRMDEVPFFEFTLERYSKTDLRTLEKFAKQSFDVDAIIREAGSLKLQSLVDAELEKEFASPSDQFVRLIAGRIHEGNLTPQVRETFKEHITRSISGLIRDKVNDRLNSALSASNPHEEEPVEVAGADEIVTTEEELAGYNIVRAIAARVIDPARVVIRDAKSYCAVLLDDNNRKPLARLHFNSENVRYLGLFTGKDETRHSVAGAIDIYKFEKALLERIAELEG